MARKASTATNSDSGKSGCSSPPRQTKPYFSAWRTPQSAHRCTPVYQVPRRTVHVLRAHGSISSDRPWVGGNTRRHQQRTTETLLKWYNLTRAPIKLRRQVLSKTSKYTKPQQLCSVSFLVHPTRKQHRFCWDGTSNTNYLPPVNSGGLHVDCREVYVTRNITRNSGGLHVGCGEVYVTRNITLAQIGAVQDPALSSLEDQPPCVKWMGFGSSARSRVPPPLAYTLIRGYLIIFLTCSAI